MTAAERARETERRCTHVDLGAACFPCILSSLLAHEAEVLSVLESAWSVALGQSYAEGASVGDRLNAMRDTMRAAFKTIRDSGREQP